MVAGPRRRWRPAIDKAIEGQRAATGPMTEQLADAMHGLEFRGLTAHRQDARGRPGPRGPDARRDQEGARLSASRCIANMMICAGRACTTPVGQKSPDWVQDAQARPAQRPAHQDADQYGERLRAWNADEPLLLLASLDGCSYAALLFLVALGLTLIFGVLRHPQRRARQPVRLRRLHRGHARLAVGRRGLATSACCSALLVAAALVVGVVLGVADRARAAAPRPGQGRCCSCSSPSPCS